MVAKSFQSMTIINEPYMVNGKMYVQVKNEKTGNTRQVRWYTEEEYAKMYPEAKPVDKNFFKPQKEVFGFDKGYITIFKGDTYANLEWFQKSIARYTRYWGWYIISTEEIPVDLPAGVDPIQLNWELVGNEDGSLKIESEVKRAVESLIYDEGISEYIGSIGERIEVTVTVTAARELDGYYGRSTMHTMEDEDGNVYVWTTGAKNWTVGSIKTIKGTIKDHKTFRNVKQTILTRCMEVK